MCVDDRFSKIESHILKIIFITWLCNYILCIYVAVLCSQVLQVEGLYIALAQYIKRRFTDKF